MKAKYTLSVIGAILLAAVSTPVAQADVPRNHEMKQVLRAAYRGDAELKALLQEGVNINAADKDGEFSDWIEIYNGSGRAVSMKGYMLGDDEGKRDKWIFPEEFSDYRDYQKEVPFLIPVRRR